MRTKLLVAFFAGVVPLCAAGVVAVLVTHALLGSWTWSILVLMVVALAYGLLLAATARWARARPTEASGLVANWGRALAMNSGGWQRRKRNDPDSD
jgi:hypothetical protein